MFFSSSGLLSPLPCLYNAFCSNQYINLCMPIKNHCMKGTAIWLHCSATGFSKRSDLWVGYQSGCVSESLPRWMLGHSPCGIQLCAEGYSPGRENTEHHTVEKRNLHVPIEVKQLKSERRLGGNKRVGRLQRMKSYCTCQNKGIKLFTFLYSDFQ